MVDPATEETKDTKANLANLVLLAHPARQDLPAHLFQEETLVTSNLASPFAGYTGKRRYVRRTSPLSMAPPNLMQLGPSRATLIGNTSMLHRMPRRGVV